MGITTQFLGLIVYGVQWVLWLLIGLSICSVAVMLERFWYFATYRKGEQALAADMQALLQRNPARSGAAGWEETGPAEVLAAAAAGAKARERLRLERNLAFLGTLGSNAPFVGLFGTVLGIIKAFHDLAGNQAGGPAVVMAGISEALVATAVGLMVAIPAVVAFNYFNRRVRTTMTQVEWMTELALAQLRAAGQPGSETGKAVPVLAAKPGRLAALRSAAWPRWHLLLLAAGGLVLSGFLLGKRGGHQAVSSPSGAAPARPTIGSPDGGHLDERVDMLAKMPAGAEPSAARPVPADARTVDPGAEPTVKPDAAPADEPQKPDAAIAGKASRPPKGKRKRAPASQAPQAQPKQGQPEAPAASRPALDPAAATEVP